MDVVWQELQRDVHKQQRLIDEELTQSIDCIKANAATGAGNITHSTLPSAFQCQFCRFLSQFAVEKDLYGLVVQVSYRPVAIHVTQSRVFMHQHWSQAGKNYPLDFSWDGCRLLRSDRTLLSYVVCYDWMWEGIFYIANCQKLPSMLWRCWLGGRKWTCRCDIQLKETGKACLMTVEIQMRWIVKAANHLIVIIFFRMA